MNHVNHADLPGYNPRQVWVDGCEACERLGRGVPFSIRFLGPTELRQATGRARRRRYVAGDPFGEYSLCETPLLDLLGQWLNTTRQLRKAGWYDVSEVDRW